MEEILQHFEAALKQKGWDIDYLLQPGLPVEAVFQLFDTVAFPVPAALQTLYCWRNGTASKSSEEFIAYFARLDAANQQVLWPDSTQPPLPVSRRTSFFPEIGTFLSLQAALAGLVEAVEQEFWPENFWPIFHDDSLLLDIDPSSPTFGRVHIWSPSMLILEPEPYYDSLETMFTTYLEAVRAGFVSPDPAVEHNFDGYSKLAIELNPLSSYWTS